MLRSLRARDCPRQGQGRSDSRHRAPSRGAEAGARQRVRFPRGGPDYRHHRTERRRQEHPRAYHCERQFAGVGRDPPRRRAVPGLAERPDRPGRSVTLPQAVDLMSGTISENIRRFAPVTPATGEALSEKVVRAAMAAGVHDLILNLPMAYDTPVGAGGKGLSFGQAQRVGLARALYGDPMLLVLDEPNAHVDEEGEIALISAMHAAKARGASVVVVAHRARLISAADGLLVLRNGVLIESGAREKVVAKMQSSAAATPRVGAAVSMIRPRPQGSLE